MQKKQKRGQQQTKKNTKMKSMLEISESDTFPMKAKMTHTAKTEKAHVGPGFFSILGLL